MRKDFNRRDFLKIIGLGAAVLVTPGCTSVLKGFAGEATKEKPNVLFIAIDDLNDWANCLGGRAGVKTPNLDRLAAHGVLFANAHCSAPACNPSRASIMTGIRPSTSGIYTNGPNWRTSPVLKDAVTIPEHFRAHGYRVVGGGKIFHALSWVLREDGQDGFNDPACWDEYFPSKIRAMPDAIWPNETIRQGNSIRWEPVVKGRTGTRPPWFFDWSALKEPDKKMADYKVVDWAIGELHKKHDKPFFQAVGIFRPHIPWYVPQKYFDMYPLDKVTLPRVRKDWKEYTPPAGQNMGEFRRKWHKWVVDNKQWKKAIQGYLAGISFADAQLGRLLDALDAGKYARNTIIVLWADHGFHLGERETWEKFTLWEESTRVSLMFVVPGVTKPAGRCSRPASLLDVYPTLVELCSLTPKPELEGTSLVPLLRNPRAPSKRAVVTTWLQNNHAVRSERWRYIRYKDGSEELYDHKNDPDEFVNLAGLKKYDSVKDELAAWIPKVNVTGIGAPGKTKQVKVIKKNKSTSL